MDEESLHVAWQAGDKNATVQVVSQYLPRLRGFGHRLGLRPDQAKELAHEVLMQARGSHFEARDDASYWNWLSTIARRHATRIHREEHQHPASLSIRRVTTPWSGTCRQLLLDAVGSMPPLLREVFAWWMVGYSSVEIAQKLGLTPAAVRMRLQRGRRWLRDQAI